MQTTEILKMAWASVRANTMRSVLTLMIIAFGIMALVGILTALDSLIFSLNDNFNELGSNSFTIERKFQDLQRRGPGKKSKRGQPIDYVQAMDFKERFNYPCKISISLSPTQSATVQHDEKKSNPNVSVLAVNENGLSVKGFEVQYGRSFSDGELQSGANKAIIGTDIVKMLFNKNPQSALNSDMLLGNIRYRIVGVLKSKGSGGGSQGADRQVMIPLLNAKNVFDTKGQDYGITVGVASAIEMEQAGDVASGVFRQIRRLRLDQEDDFEIFKSDSLLKLLKDNTVYIRWAAIVIGIITLLGAAIGLMNIMLVSVTERTREIGIRKSLGATSRGIMTQFLIEAVVICQLGGFVGIFLGVLAGLGVALAAGGHFVMPWAWIIMGVLTCLFVGLFAGLYPAMKAAQLDPIEALRYE